MFRVVHLLMRAAPVGAFGAIAFTIGKYGLAVLANLAWLVGAFYASALLFVLVVLGAVARLSVFDPQAGALPEGGIAAGAGHLVVRNRRCRR